MPGLFFRAFALAGFSLAASAALSAPAFQQDPASGLLDLLGYRRAELAKEPEML